MMPPDYWDCFASSYVGARANFRNAARQAGVEWQSYAHPVELAGDGSALSIDVAHLGDVRGARQLLVISGTHGLEGAAGSALQVAWMRSLREGAIASIPPGVGVLLVHSFNPYGHEHGTRGTENNVDLNRNFVDHQAPYPDNPGYAALHAALIPEHWTQAAFAAIEDATREFEQIHGADALYNALTSGQYDHPDGLVYGGRAREWSNRMLERIVRDKLGSAEQVGFIDWHTGIGAYGEPFFLCFHPSGSAQESLAASWWGRERVLGQRPNGLARPDYQGLVFHGVHALLEPRSMVGAVVEFGTRGLGTRYALRLDQWLRHRAPHQPNPERDAQLRADLADAFVPLSSVWRNSVLRHGMRITQQAVLGLSAW